MNNLKKILLALFFIGLPLSVHAKLNVVTTTEDLASIAKEVGGDLISVTALARGYQDPHFVDAKPSYLLKLRKADLFIQVGLELEVAWAPALLSNSRNREILPGNKGFLDASAGVEILQKPQGAVDRSMGDIHTLGNPHYWLDPQNGLIIAQTIAARLSQLDASHAADYKANLSRFEKRLSEKQEEWNSLASSLKGMKIVTYHGSWPNFAKRFGLNVVNYVEPKPGIPPSPAHVSSLITQISQEKIPLIVMEPYFDQKLPEKIARQGGAAVAVAAPSVGADPSIKTYFDLFDYNLRLLTQSLKTGKGIQ